MTTRISRFSTSTSGQIQSGTVFIRGFVLHLNAAFVVKIWSRDQSYAFSEEGCGDAGRSARAEGTGIHPGIHHPNGRFVFTIQHLAESKGAKQKSSSDPSASPRPPQWPF